jgi:hypothetical protein
MIDFNIGDNVSFGMYVPRSRDHRLTSDKFRRNRPESHTGVVTGWLGRGKIVVNETRNDSTFTHIFSKRKSGNYILEGTMDVSKKFANQSLQLLEVA